MEPKKRRIFAGSIHSLIHQGGELFRAGKTDNFSDSECNKEFLQVKLPNDERVEQVFSNRGLTYFVLTQSGRLYGYGTNSNCQLGQPSDERHINGQLINNFPKLYSHRRIINVFCFWSTFVQFDNYDCFAFGYNWCHNLGLNLKEHIVTPTKISLPNNEKIMKIAVGDGHSIFISTKGNIYGCGFRSEGQLGDVSEIPKCYSSPREIGFFRKNGIKVVDVDCGDVHSLFLAVYKRDSSRCVVYSCGSNRFGQCGVENVRLYSSHLYNPLMLIDTLVSKNVTKVRAGRENSFFVTSSMQIFACGNNLGIEKTTKRQGFGVVKKNCAVGSRHVLLLGLDGRVYFRGDQADGRSGIKRQLEFGEIALVKGFRIINERKSLVFRKKMLANNSYADITIITTE